MEAELARSAERLGNRGFSDPNPTSSLPGLTRQSRSHTRRWGYHARDGMLLVYTEQDTYLNGPDDGTGREEGTRRTLEGLTPKDSGKEWSLRSHGHACLV